MQLSAQHDSCEYSKEQGLGYQEQEEHHRGGGRVRAAVAPLVPDARHELVRGESQRVDRYGGYVELKTGYFYCLSIYCLF